MNEAIGRAHLESAIGRAQARNAARELRQRAGEARDQVAVTIAQHPFLALGGALMLGVVIGSMMPRRKPSRSAAALGAMFAETALAYGREMLDKTRDTMHDLKEHVADAVDSR